MTAKMRAPVVHNRGVEQQISKLLLTVSSMMIVIIVALIVMLLSINRQ